MKRLGLPAMLVLASLAASAGTAHASWKYVNVGGAASAIWNSCPDVSVGEPCAFTFIAAATATADVGGPIQRDCVFVQQARGLKLNDFGLRGGDNTYANACGSARVLVDAAPRHAAVDGTLPARNCHFDPASAVESCTPTTLAVSVAWSGSGEVLSGGALTYRYSYEAGQRCLYHALPARSRTATTTGGIDGVPARMGGLQDAALSFGGLVNVGTDSGCWD
jgi:hypothetical protein